MSAPKVDPEALLVHLDEAVEFADRLIGRSVAIVADSNDPHCPEAERDQVEIAHLAGMLRSALLGARAQAVMVRASGAQEAAE